MWYTTKDILWRDHPIAMMDIETTGLDLYADRVVEMACVVLEGREITRRFTTMVNPGVPIPVEASRIHGITDEAVAGAPSFAESLTGLVDCVGSEASIVVPAAFNHAFDKPFLAVESVRHCGIVPWFLSSRVGWLDPYVYGRRAFKYEPGKKQLMDIARLCGAKTGDAHTAEGDCMTALRCLFRLAERKLSDHPADRGPLIPSRYDVAIERQEMFAAQESASMLDYIGRKRAEKEARGVVT